MDSPILITVDQGDVLAEVRHPNKAKHVLVFNLCAPMLEERWGDPSYRHRREVEHWDGRQPYYQWDGGTGGLLPVGLIPVVTSALDHHGVAYHVDDRRIALHAVANGAEACGALEWDHEAYPHQVEAVDAALGAPGGVVHICTGGGKTAVMAALVKAFEDFVGLPRTLVVVSKANLLVQTRDALSGLLGGPVGQWGGRRRDLEPRVVVATIQAIAAALRDPMRLADTLDVLRDVQLLMFDEGHHLAGRARRVTKRSSAKAHAERRAFPEGIWSAVARRCPAQRRYLFSGTPLTESTLQNWEVTAYFGLTLVSVEYERLVNEGVLARPSLVYYAVHEPIYTGEEYRALLRRKIDGFTAQIEGQDRRLVGKLIEERAKVQARLDEAFGGRGATAPITEVRRECIALNLRRDADIVAMLAALRASGMKTLVLVEARQHGDRLACVTEGCTAFVSGAMTGQEQAEAFREFDAAPPGSILVANSVADEGTDIPSVNALVVAAGMKSYVKVFQRLGRGLRRKADNRVLVIDVMDFTHNYLASAARKRVAEYDRAGVASGAFPLLGVARTPEQFGRLLDAYHREVADAA